MKRDFELNQEEYDRTINILKQEKPTEQELSKTLNWLKITILFEPLGISSVRNNISSRVEAMVDYGFGIKKVGK